MTPSVIGWILVVPRAGGCVLELSVSLRWAVAFTAGHLATHGSVLVLEQEDLLAYQTAGGSAALSLKWCVICPCGHLLRLAIVCGESMHFRRATFGAPVEVFSPARFE